MSSESLTISPQPPQHKSLESLGKRFKQRLDAILHKQLKIENIETFADEALAETVQLNEDIMTEYLSNQEIPVTQMTDREHEDEAYKIFGLEKNINEVLQSIIDVKNKIDSLKTYIDTNVENINEIITPPQENRSVNIAGGDGSFREKKIFPRLLTLLYIIEHDFGITPTPKSVPIKEGIVTPKMMRKTPYVRIEIPELNRVVYICDEEDNASYVFDTVKLIEKGLILDEIDLDDKGDKNSLIAYHPGIGIRIIQSTAWRSRVATALGEPIPEVQKGIPEKHEREERSEFEKPKWLPFDEFQAEVRALYPRQGDVQAWYYGERKKHTNWPWNSQIYIIYNKHWEGWPELVGIENRLKKNFLSFSDFQREIKALYPGKGDIYIWYHKERKNHKNWPAEPRKTYSDKGWVGFPELVGIENFLKKEYLSFDKYQAEVRALYPRQGDVQVWYKKEKNNHRNWPSNPARIYKDVGWIGWPELVGAENFLKKEFLSFDKFKVEVRLLYPMGRNIEKWYREEKRKHPNWPSSPSQMYRDMGWGGFADLVEEKK